MNQPLRKINLQEHPQIEDHVSSLFLYREKTGPFATQAPLAWQEFWQCAGVNLDQSLIKGMVSLSRIDSTLSGDGAFIYQAGVLLKSNPKNIPEGLALKRTEAGRFATFTLTGSYAQLPHAFPRIFQILHESNIQVRESASVESYINNPANTPEDQLITEISIPIA